MTEPYPHLGERIRFEAILQGSSDSERLRLEFWAETPSGEFMELVKVETETLSAGEQAQYSAEIVPEQEGMYTIYAYLYDGAKRIGHELERVYVKET